MGSFLQFVVYYFICCTLLPFCPFLLFVLSLSSPPGSSNIFSMGLQLSLTDFVFPTSDKNNPAMLHQPTKGAYSFVICITILLSLHFNLMGVLHPLRILFCTQLLRERKIIRSCTMVPENHPQRF